MWRYLRTCVLLLALVVVFWAPAGAVVGQLPGSIGEGRADIDPNGQHPATSLLRSVGDVIGRADIDPNG